MAAGPTPPTPGALPPTRVRWGAFPAGRPPDFAEPEDVWILGTSHLSAESADEVERVLRAVRPDNVVVELCRSRHDPASRPTATGHISSPFPSSKSERCLYSALTAEPGSCGQSALALRLLLAVFSSKISSGANRPFGEEFRAARRVSEDIGAQLVLGDRPIEITLERALKSLSWDEKTKLVISLFRGITSTTHMPQQDEKAAVSPYELYEKLSSSYPSLLQPLIHERDMFMAWSLKRSKAVNKSKTVVGVIGKGHMNGVVYALISDQGDLRFRDLVGRESSETWASSVVKGLVRDTVIGLALWALYELLQAAAVHIKL
ncbi:hypothetical protein TRIUR3_13244 [Triticum urartu]|uniref:TraB domain-containing protein n=1 Tax=Triticum urartu TaxID=4572 RepID=M7YG97_TRIUA|nr:hypothetical protein TRIUR3_13244 [Triticum urartu]